MASPAVPEGERSGRSVLKWSVGLLLALGVLAAFCGLLLYPYCQTQRILESVPEQGAERAIERLGGKEHAARKLSLYLRLPARLAGYRFVAARLLGHCGESAVPALVRALDDHNPIVRVMAIDSLGNIGPPARPAIPKLVAMLHDDTVVAGWFVISRDAERALAGIGPAAVGPLVQELRSANPPKLEVCQFMTKSAEEQRAVALSDGLLFASAPGAVLRPRPAQAADELLLYLRLPGDLAPHKFEAAWVLGSAARESEPDSALLSAALAEPDMAVRRYAALAAGVSGDAKLAPQLAGRLSDAEPAVRLEAARALGRIGAADSAPALTKATGDGDLIVRLAATAALTWVAPASAEAKAALAKAQAEVEKAGIPAVIHAAYKRSQDQDPSGGAWLVQVICRPAALRFCSAMVIDDHYEVDMNMDLRDLRGGRRDCVTEEGAKLLKTQGYVDLKPFLLVALPGHPQGAYIYIRRGDPKGVGAPGPEASPAR